MTSMAAEVISTMVSDPDSVAGASRGDMGLRLPSGVMPVDPSSAASGPFLGSETYVSSIGSDSARVANLCRSTAIDAPVPVCDGWDLGAAVRHLGWVQRWATECVRLGAMAERDSVSTPDGSIDAEGLADWFAEGADALVDVLRSSDSGAPAFLPFRVPQTVASWQRRLAHETSVHRVDVESAVDQVAPIDAVLASDGVDEYLSAALVRILGSGRASVPTGSLHIHCTDVAGEWLVVPDGDGFALTREHAKGDAAIRGAAADVLLALWGRRGVAAALGGADLDVVGDTSVAEAWLAIGGV